MTTVHPGVTYTERILAILEERAQAQGITVEGAERRMAEGNSIHHIVDAIAGGGGVGRAIHY